MHNVMLREDSDLNLRVRWLRGTLYPTSENMVPTFDDRNSFRVVIEAGVVGTSMADLSRLLNSSASDSPFKNIAVRAQGKQLKVTGTLHKGIPLPVEMIADLSASSDGRIRVHAAKLRVLKLPVKDLLKTFHVSTADLIDSSKSKGIVAEGDDLLIDPEQILPPPKKQGKLTDVHISKLGDVVQIYGAAQSEARQVKAWRNYMKLEGGTFTFGKLTMHNVDMTMIDISSDDWFDFDLSRYQQQLVNGYTHLTPQAGLQVFMPDISKIPTNQASRRISVEWMRNRYQTPPASATH
jgi:hypothetical protein